MDKMKEKELIAGIKKMPSYNYEYKRKKINEDEDIETEIDDTVEDIVVEEEYVEEQANENELIKLKIGDEEKELSLEELKQGYMMQSDYTKKTQELALLKEEYSASLKNATNAMAAFNDLTTNPRFRNEERNLKNILDKVNWDKVSEADLNELIKMKIRYEKIKKENESYVSHVENLRTLMKEENKIYRQRMAQEQIEKLQTIDPDLADEIKRKEIMDKVNKYLSDRIGEDKVEKILHSIVDHRDFLILRDAAIGNDYLTNKLPKKSVIKPVKKIGNDGIKDGLMDTNKKTKAERTLRQVKARGERSAASTEELMTIFASKIK